MIVRDLLIKLGFQTDTDALPAMDRQIGRLKASSVAVGTILANVAQQGFSRLAQQLSQGVDQSLQFGREMGNISSLIDGNRERTRELAGDTKALALQFGRSTSEINQGLYDVIGTLGDSRDATAQLSLAIKLGAAGAGTTADGFGLLAAVTKAYGDTSLATMRKVSNLATRTVNLGKVTLPELGASIGQVTPLASQLGISIEEVMAAQATLSGVTGTGAEVFTQMASAMKSITERSPEMDKAFRRAFAKDRIKTAKEAIGRYGFQGALSRVIATTDGTQEAIGKLFGRIEGLKFGLAATGNQADEYRRKLAQMRDIGEDTDIAFRAQTTGIAENAHKMALLDARASALRTRLGGELTPTILAAKAGAIDFAEVVGGQVVDALNNAAAASAHATSEFGAKDSPFARMTGALGIGAAGFGDALATVARLAVTEARWAGTAAFGSAEDAARAKGAVIETGTGFAARARQYAIGIAEPETAHRIAEYHRIAEEAQQEVAEHGGTRRERARAWLTDPRAAWSRAGAQAVAREAAGREPRGLASFLANLGGVTINVSVPPGTEAGAAARIGDTSARVLMAQVLDQAQRALGGGD